MDVISSLRPSYSPFKLLRSVGITGVWRVKHEARFRPKAVASSLVDAFGSTNTGTFLRMQTSTIVSNRFFGVSLHKQTIEAFCFSRHFKELL